MGQKDRWTPHRYIHPTSHSMWSVLVISVVVLGSWSWPWQWRSWSSAHYSVVSVCDGKSYFSFLHVTVSLDRALPHCTVAVAIHWWVDLRCGYNRCCSSRLLILVLRRLWAVLSSVLVLRALVLVLIGLETVVLLALLLVMTGTTAREVECYIWCSEDGSGVGRNPARPPCCIQSDPSRQVFLLNTIRYTARQFSEYMSVG